MAAAALHTVTFTLQHSGSVYHVMATLHTMTDTCITITNSDSDMYVAAAALLSNIYTTA